MIVLKSVILESTLKIKEYDDVTN